jgi:hypothetical protein
MTTEKFNSKYSYKLVKKFVKYATNKQSIDHVVFEQIDSPMAFGHHLETIDSQLTMILDRHYIETYAVLGPLGDCCFLNKLKYREIKKHFPVTLYFILNKWYNANLFYIKEITLHEHTNVNNSLDYVIFIRLVAIKKNRNEMLRV